MKSENIENYYYMDSCNKASKYSTYLPLGK